RLRPISRLISWVRPPTRPLIDSRSERVWVDRGSIAYSLVTQPRPEPFRQRGTPSVTLAATSTRVWPNSTSTEPSACSSQLRVNFTVRSWSRDRPSALVVTTDHPNGARRRPGGPPRPRGQDRPGRWTRLPTSPPRQTTAAPISGTADRPAPRATPAVAAPRVAPAWRTALIRPPTAPAPSGGA